jgi:hypothetical protein
VFVEEQFPDDVRLNPEAQITHAVEFEHLLQFEGQATQVPFCKEYPAVQFIHVFASEHPAQKLGQDTHLLPLRIYPAEQF